MSNEKVLEVSQQMFLGLTHEDWQSIMEYAEREVTPEEEAEYELMYTQARKMEKRSKRLKDCGSFAYWFDPHTGKRTGFVMHCDLFRECPSCLQRRATREYEWMKKATITKDIYTITFDNKSDASRFVRGVHKSKYARYPRMDGTELIFIDASEEKAELAEPMASRWLMNQDWTQIVLTPEGRNKSGTIHVPQSPEDEEPFTIVNAKQFVTEAPIEAIEKASEEVIAETSDMNPTTPNEVLFCMNRRLNKTIQKLRKHGFDCRIYQKKLKVIHSRIDWSGDMLDFSVNDNFSCTTNLTFNTKNLTSEGEKICTEGGE